MRCRVLSRHGIGLAVILACSMFIAQRLGAADQWTDGDGPRISPDLDERHGDWIMLCYAKLSGNHTIVLSSIACFSFLFCSLLSFSLCMYPSSRLDIKVNVDSKIPLDQQGANDNFLSLYSYS